MVWRAAIVSYAETDCPNAQCLHFPAVPAGQPRYAVISAQWFSKSPDNSNRHAGPAMAVRGLNKTLLRDDQNKSGAGGSNENVDSAGHAINKELPWAFIGLSVVVLNICPTGRDTSTSLPSNYCSKTRPMLALDGNDMFLEVACLSHSLTTSRIPLISKDIPQACHW